MVGGVAKEIGYQKGDDPAEGIGPAHNLLISDRSFPEASADELVQRDVLHCPQAHSQPHQSQAPQAGPRRCPDPSPASFSLLPPPHQDNARQSIIGHHQQSIVGDLHVSCQQVHPQSHPAAHNLQQRCPPLTPLPALHDPLQHHQQPGQPAGGGDDHGENYAHHHEGREHINDGPNERPEGAEAQGAQEKISEEPGQHQLQPGEVTIGPHDGHDVKEQAEGIHGRVLACGQEGHATEEVGVPQRQLTPPQALHDELLPDIVLQDEVTEQAVMWRQGHAHLLGELPVGFPFKEVVKGEQCLSREEHRPKQDGRQEGQN